MNVRPKTDSIALLFFFFSSRRRHTRFDCDWSSDVCSSDLEPRSWPERKGAFRAEQATYTLAEMPQPNAMHCLVVDDEPRLRRVLVRVLEGEGLDRKSTRLNSSHSQISDAVFCLKKNTKKNKDQ